VELNCGAGRPHVGLCPKFVVYVASFYSHRSTITVVVALSAPSPAIGIDHRVQELTVVWSGAVNVWIYAVKLIFTYTCLSKLLSVECESTALRRMPATWLSTSRLDRLDVEFSPIRLITFTSSAITAITQWHVSCYITYYCRPTEWSIKSKPQSFMHL